jgi:hypothetical protein
MEWSGEVPIWAVTGKLSGVWVVCDRTGTEPQRVTSTNQSEKKIISVNPSANRVVAIHLSLFSKGKAIPLQAWTGPEGSRRLKLSNFK